MRSLFTFVLIHFLLFQHGYSQAVPNQSKLNLEAIMKGEAFVGYLPSNIRWAENSQDILFSWNPNQDTLRSIYRVNIGGGDPTQLVNEERMNLVGRGVYSRDGSKKVYTRNGDLFLLDIPTKNTIQITNTVAFEYNPGFSGDESSIYFTRENNLFVWSIVGGQIKQLTNFKKGKKQATPTTYPHEDWLQRDQLRHFEILGEREAVSDLRKAQNEKLKVKRPKEIYFGNASISNIRVSPDLKFVTYRLTTSSRAKGTKVPDFVTESGYLKDLRARTKVGTPQSTTRMGIYQIEQDSFFFVDKTTIEGIFDKPAFLKDYADGEGADGPLYDDPREVSILGPVFSEKGQALVVVRSADNKDRWIMTLDLESGKFDLIDRQRDEAWVGGPGIQGWNGSIGNVGWLDQGRNRLVSI